MGTEIVKQEPTEIAAKDMESLLMGGNLAALPPATRLAYYKRRCEDMGLDSLARPFDYLFLNGKLVLYANKGCFEQLRANRHISINIVSQAKIDDLYIVTAKATLPDGRCDEDTGAVDMAGKKGELAANAILKAITKAKRRVTLSICGLGMLDETEVDSVSGATKITVSPAGELIGETAKLKGHTYLTIWNGVPVEYHDFKHLSHEYCLGPESCNELWQKLTNLERNRELGFSNPAEQVPPQGAKESSDSGEFAGLILDGAALDDATGFPQPAPVIERAEQAAGSSPPINDKKEFMGRMKALAIHNGDAYHGALQSIGPSEGYQHASQVPTNRQSAVEDIVRKAVLNAGPAKQLKKDGKQLQFQAPVDKARDASND